MSYLKNLIKSFWFWFFLAIPILIEFLISCISGNLYPVSFLRYLNKGLLVVKVNISYYASIFAIGLSYLKYLSDKKDQEERNNKLEQQLLHETTKSNQLKEEELEKYLDQYRPAFVRNDNYLILVMKKENLYIKNVVFFLSPELDSGINKGDLKHGDTIWINGKKNNYFILGETLLGEKFIYGNILNNIDVYKVLKMGSKLKQPKLDSDIKEIDESIDNWRSYNTGTMQINEAEIKEDMISYIKNIDRIFMNKTKSVREKVWLNSSYKELNVKKIESLAELFKATLDQFNGIRENHKKEILVMVLEGILYDNKSRIKIDLETIEENDRKDLKINNLTKEYSEISAYELFKRIKINNPNLHTVVDRLKILIKYFKIDKSLNELLLEYANLILMIFAE